MDECFNKIRLNALDNYSFLNENWIIDDKGMICKNLNAMKM